MQVIKKVLIILYTLILGFIVFCNTSVFADDIDVKDKFVKYVSNGYDDYWVNMQDSVDDMITRYSNKNGNQQVINNINSLRNSVNTFNYVAIPVLNVPNYLGVSYNSGEDLRGYIFCIYNTASTTVTSSTDFTYGTINDFYGGYYDNVSYFDNSFSFNAVKVNTFRTLGVWNNGNSFGQKTEDAPAEYVPLSVLNYYHRVYYSYIDRSNTSGASQITSSINNQTNTIVNETKQQTEAITNSISSSTQQQTNEILDTNNTGNETLEVNANVTDNSVNLDNFFTSIYNAFTSASGVITKKLTLTLPNNNSFDVNVRSDMLSNFFENNTIFKVFYQAIWWVALGGFVIFDVKRMYNLVMIGKWDVLGLIDKPSDIIVDLSTGSHGKGGSIY